MMHVEMEDYVDEILVRAKITSRVQQMVFDRLRRAPVKSQEVRLRSFIWPSISSPFSRAPPPSPVGRSCRTSPYRRSLLGFIVSRRGIEG